MPKKPRLTVIPSIQEQLDELVELRERNTRLMLELTAMTDRCNATETLMLYYANLWTGGE